MSNKIRKILVLFSVMVLLASIFSQSTIAEGAAATYYVSSSVGDDANDGLSPETAWKTLEQVTAQIEDGDTILLKRGDTFRGFIKAYKDEDVIIGAYGSGANPVLKGSVEIAGWTPTSHPALDSSTVYEADVAALSIPDTGMPHLFVDETIMTVARYPNVDSPDQENWLNFDSGGTLSFIDAALIAHNSQNNYWNGATVRYRKYSWEFAANTIEDYDGSNGQVTVKKLSDNYKAGFKSNWGYFLDNKLEELDHPGEWYYDVASKKVYLYPPVGVDPNSALVEGIIHNKGVIISWKSHRATVQDLEIKQYAGSCIDFNSSDNPTARNNTLEHCHQGIYNYNGNNFWYENNEMDYARANGILIGSNITGHIIGNTIKNTGVLRIYAITESVHTYGCGINVRGNNVTIKNNWIENTAYSAIEITGSGPVIENNFIRKPQIALNDGGAIIVRNDDFTIKNNIILECYGNVGPSNGDAFDGQGWPHPSYGIGIFFMGNYNNIKIEGNTIAGCRDRGILLDKSSAISIKDNTFYHNRLGIYTKNAPNGVEITGNIMFAGVVHNPARTHVGLSLDSGIQNLTLDNNLYCNPYTGIDATRSGGSYSLDFWKAKFPQYDQHSTACSATFDRFEITSSGANLLANPNFDTDASDWGSLDFDPGKPEMDGGSGKADFSGGKKVIVQNNRSLENGQWYHFQADAIGDNFFDIKLSLANPDDWTETILDRNDHFIFSQNKSSVDGFFIAKKTLNNAKLVLGSGDWLGTAYWMDNVVLEPVSVAERDKSQIVINTADAASLDSDSALLVNPYTQAQTFDLPPGKYVDLDGSLVNSVTLSPYASKILLKTDKLIAAFAVDKTFGPPPLQVEFTDKSSGNPTSWEWDFDNNGVIDSTAQNITHTFPITEAYSVKLTVSDGVITATATKTIVASNNIIYLPIIQKNN